MKHRIAEYTPEAGLVYRDMTEYEIEQAEALEANTPAQEATIEERIDDIEAAVVEVAEYAAEQEARYDVLESALVELAELIGG